MKKIIYLFAVVLAVSCADKKQKLVEINVDYTPSKEYVGKYLSLISDHDVKLDSILLQETNTITFSVPKEDRELPYALTIKKADKRNTLFFAGTHDVKINLEDVVFYDNRELKISNINSEGLEQQAYSGYYKGIDKLDEEDKELRIKWDSLRRAGLLSKPELRDPLEELFIKNSDNKLKYNEDYINSFKNAASLGLLNTSFRFKYKVNQLDSLAKLFPEKYYDFATYESIQERIGIMKNVEIGAEAPDFTIPDPDGNPVSLSSFRGNYVLLDFWASWCGPCRQENPHVRAAYQKYKDQGFQVLGVSYDYPKMRDKWLKAIKDDKLEWTQVSNLNGWKDPTAKLYNISGIPSPFLIDPDGKIVEKGDELRNEKLDKVLKSIYSK